jgi:ribosome-binding ATPase
MLWAIVGLQGSGKTTLFNLLTHKGSSNSGRGMDIAVMKVHDPRIEPLLKIFEPAKITYAEIEFADTAGGFGKGGTNIELQRAGAMVYCIRAFDAGFGEPNPAKDLAELTGELNLFDLGILERKLENLEKILRAPKSDERLRVEKEKVLIENLHKHLDSGGVIRDLDLSPEQETLVANFGLFTAKPAIVVINCDEKNYANRENLISTISGHKHTEVIAIMTQMELEISELPPEDAAVFRADLGLTEPIVESFVRKAYYASNEITFFTGGEKEVRGWTISAGSKALDAAAKIHTDLARGFIRAELVAYDDLLKAGSWNACRANGTLRQEGKEYVIKDGDVLIIKFAI